MTRNRVLGKGLSALLVGANLTGIAREGQGTVAGGLERDGGVSHIALDSIGLNSKQPRKMFDDSKLNELAESIKQVGVIQPVLVRKMGSSESIRQHPDSAASADSIVYSVVAGERRVRAAWLAGLTEIPALVCSYEETESLKIALLENIQREDLDPVEEGQAYRDLMKAYGATQEELAGMLGKSRSGVANLVRLLDLEEEILDLLQGGKISKGHAKVLSGMPAGPARVNLAKICGSRGLSVRECEARLRAGGARPTKRPRSARGVNTEEPTVRALRQRAERVYGSPVAIERQAKTGKGTIKLRFYSDDDLVRLLKIMGVDTEL